LSLSLSLWLSPPLSEQAVVLSCVLTALLLCRAEGLRERERERAWELLCAFRRCSGTSNRKQREKARTEESEKRRKGEAEERSLDSNTALRFAPGLLSSILQAPQRERGREGGRRSPSPH
ncbi:hypothetical protein ANANG_G00312940, partial [Anguilla anguilla]